MVIIATIQTIKEEQQFIMPVFDFSNSKTEKKDPECTYTTFQSNEKVPSPEKPILIIDNKSRQWKHHSCGVFSNPNQKSSCLLYTSRAANLPGRGGRKMFVAAYKVCQKFYGFN